MQHISNARLAWVVTGTTVAALETWAVLHPQHEATLSSLDTHSLPHGHPLRPRPVRRFVVRVRHLVRTTHPPNQRAYVRYAERYTNVTRKPDRPCDRCGRLLWRTKASHLDKQVCHPCRRLEPEPHPHMRGVTRRPYRPRARPATVDLTAERRYCTCCGRRVIARYEMCAACRGKGDTSARGYGPEHIKMRNAWKPTVAAGNAQCHARTCLMPSRWIPPGAAWDLGHTPDRSDWTGPEHRRCNRSEGATRGNRTRGHRLTPKPRTTTSEAWFD